MPVDDLALKSDAILLERGAIGVKFIFFLVRDLGAIVCDGKVPRYYRI